MNSQKKWLLIVACGLVFLMTIFNKADLRHPAFAGVGPSTIAGIPVEDLTDQEIQKLLKEAIIEWGNKQVTISGGGETINLTMAGLQYDVTATIETYRVLSKKSWYSFWAKTESVSLPLEVFPNENLKKQVEKVSIWNTEATYEELLTQAANLGSHTIEAVVDKSIQLDGERIFVHTEPLIDAVIGVQQYITRLNEQSFEAHEVVSFYKLVQPEQLVSNPETLDYFASLLYSVALHMNSEIIERTSQKQVPSYLKPGIEATVTKNGVVDLKFQPIETFKLKIELVNDSLLLEAYAQTTEQLGTKIVTNHEIVSPRVVTRFSKELAAGQVKLIQREKEGARYTVKRFKRDGSEEIISKDYYPPQNRILLKSSADASSGDLVEQIIERAEKGVDLNGDGLIDFDGEELTQEERLGIDDTVYDKSGNSLSGKR